jgi:hypothetical protein
MGRVAGPSDNGANTTRAELEPPRGGAVIDGLERDAVLDAVAAEWTTVVQRFYRSEIAAAVRPRPR